MRYDVFLSLALSLPGSPDVAPPPQILMGARPSPVAPAPNTAASATLVETPPAPAMMVFFEPGAIPAQAAGAKPPGGRLPAQRPEAVGRQPAIAPLRQAAVPASIYSAMSATADRTPFDYRQVQLRQDHGAWKLTAGSFLLADFGGDEHAAGLGLSAMQFYRFTEQCQVGAGPDRFSYLLAGGQAPRGTMFGASGTTFQPERLEVRQVEGQWAVCAGGEPLVKTGERQDDARRVLEVIRKLQCDRLYRLGTADGKGMTFLVRTR